MDKQLLARSAVTGDEQLKRMYRRQAVLRKKLAAYRDERREAEERKEAEQRRLKAVMDAEKVSTRARAHTHTQGERRTHTHREREIASSSPSPLSPLLSLSLSLPSFLFLSFSLSLSPPRLPLSLPCRLDTR